MPVIVLLIIVLCVLSDLLWQLGLKQHQLCNISAHDYRSMLIQ